MTDRDLILSHLQQHNPDALCQLIRRQIDMVHAAALAQLRDPHLADDATQAVFLILLRRAKELPQDVLLAGWLYKTTAYVASEMRRQQARRQRRERETAMPTSQNPTDPPHNPAGSAISREHASALHDAIARLPAADRDAIILHYLQGLPSAQVAAALHLTDTAVRVRLTRAKERLRTLLQRAGITLSAVALLGLLESSKAQAAPVAAIAHVQDILHGTVPAVAVQALVKGALHMTVRVKILLAAAVIILIAFPLGYFLMQSAALQPPVPVTMAATAPAAPPETPSQLVQGAYRDALAGNETAFLARWGSLSDDHKPVPVNEQQKRALLGVVRVMHAFDLLLTAVGEKFGPETRNQLAKQVPLSSDPADIANVTATPIDDDNVMINMGNTGPGKARITRINGVWYINTEVLETLNAAAVAQTEARLEQINALTTAVKSGQFPDAASFNAAIAQALKQLP